MSTTVTFRETLTDTGVMARRQLRKTVRRPMLVVLAFVQPVILLLMFRYVFGGAIDTGGVDYVDFLVPGIVVQTAIFGALMTGMGLNEDVAGGAVDRLRSLPMARSAVLLGRTFADVVVNVLTLSVMVAVGVAVGFRPDGSPAELLSAFVLVIGFSYVFSWISAWVGLAIKDPEAVQSAGFLWVFPVTFVSSAFVPADSMPAALTWLAEANPVTMVVDAARAWTVTGGDAAGPALGALAWLAGLLAVFVPLAVRTYRRA